MIKSHRILQCENLLLHFRSRMSRRFADRFLFPLLLLSLAPGIASGQAVAEAAGATSASATAGSAAKAPTFPSDITAGEKSKSPHLLAPATPQPEVANRQALEQNAGKHPGKLLLRSVPTHAQVWINGVFVGHAPLLLIVAPGKYQVELRGQRMEHAAGTVDLLPDETRNVSLTLSARYPIHASVR